MSFSNLPTSPLSLRLEDYDYQLPWEQIAQHPVTPRDASRLLVVSRKEQNWKHTFFREFPNYLSAGDVLVVNQSKVIPARLTGRRIFDGKPAGRIEILLTRQLDANRWEGLIGARSRIRPGFRFEVIPTAEGIDPIPGVVEGLMEETSPGQPAGRTVQLVFQKEIPLNHFGKMPLPPYLKRDSNTQDVADYQTVYAQAVGSVAAPTAGLHFTQNILEQIQAKGVSLAPVNLHVGLGTFQSIRVPSIQDHVLHEEDYDLPPSSHHTILEGRRSGGRLFLVGTTVVRALESATLSGQLQAGPGKTRLYIHPGKHFEFHWTDALLTNFHLPRSSLLLLICALIGRELALAAYQEAVQKGYRFLSYGDAMLIL